MGYLLMCENISETIVHSEKWSEVNLNSCILQENTVNFEAQFKVCGRFGTFEECRAT